ncbi:MAG: hypothetical protein KAI29_18105 [Cyclobacteriaceae bacterium]|nr:hypothetical protein [Cyclobacteriaceae bacterium]
MKRRKFIERSSRWFLLGGLIGGSGFLFYRNQIGDPANCFKNPLCNSCNQFNSCGIVAELKTDNNEGQKGK